MLIVDPHAHRLPHMAHEHLGMVDRSAEFQPIRSGRQCNLGTGHLDGTCRMDPGHHVRGSLSILFEPVT